MKHLSEERIQQTEKLIREIMKESDACGLAACIIDNSGNTVYEQFFGSRRKDHDLPVDGNTVFRHLKKCGNMLVDNILADSFCCTD